MKSLELTYPSYTKKAITFTIDDGRLETDKRMIEILKPHGIKGTFNLCRSNDVSPEEYREIYEGFEIANHCKEHPNCFSDDTEYKLSEDEFDKEEADPEYIYKHPTKDGMFYYRRAVGWRLITDPVNYVRLIDECHEELEEIFGKGSVNSFVWPFGEQKSKAVVEHIKMRGYYGIRKTGCLSDSTAFAPPADWFAWSYNATHSNLVEVAELYDAYHDDGELKMFSFGVHSVDFERFEKWGELQVFADKFGTRPNDFWYATVGEIYHYTEAAKRLSIVGGYVKNESDIALYALSSGEKMTIPPHSTIKL
ncbi:MAG: polysaccharide deacetylase family protein [Clostridia bacterium]|nr:polysaccharide deacetylase family protein [Clostridia bacterium]